MRPPWGTRTVGDSVVLAARHAAAKLVQQKRFDDCILGLIVTNIFVMSLDYWRMEQHPLQYRSYEALLWTLTHVYYVEAALKIVGFGWEGYAADVWNRFDFSLVAFSILEDLGPLLYSLLPLPPYLLRIVQLVPCCARCVLRFDGARDLRDLIKTIFTRCRR